MRLVKSPFPQNVSEFLTHYPRDASRRWSADDFQRKRLFVERNLAGSAWLDWSTPAATSRLLEADLASSDESGERHEGILLAGPAVELLDPESLFAHARRRIQSDGQLVGIIPCVRDTSLENRAYIEHATARLWPCATVDQLRTALASSGWVVDHSESTFVEIPQFNEAVLTGQLEFAGFGVVFEEITQLGFDPMAVEWGELRFAATPTGNGNEPEPGMV